MINKVHISNWSNGTRNVNREEIQRMFMTFFVNSIKEYNPDLEIVYLCDTVAYNELTPDIVKDKVTAKIVLDQFNDFPAYQWPMVKLKTIAGIEEPDVFHLDFDIIWKYDLTNIFNLIENEKIDCLFQCYELLDAGHNYYINFLRQYPYLQDIMAKVNNKLAYNAGISYYSQRAKQRLNELLTTHYEEDFIFDYCAGFEQVLVPNLLLTEGYNVNVLANLLSKLPLRNINMVISDDEYNMENKLHFKGFCKCGAFMNNIGFYHFLGDCKESDRIADFATLIYENS